MMKLEYDKEADAAYIYVEFPIKDGAVEKTVEVNKNINLDFDGKGKLLGIEILDASTVLKKEILETPS